MGNINRSCVALALVAVSCGTVSAQEFDPAKIRLGQTVVVRDASGYETKGVVQSQDLWTTFVRDQRIDQVAALRYLTALARRPDTHVMASR